MRCALTFFGSVLAGHPYGHSHIPESGHPDLFLPPFVPAEPLLKEEEYVVLGPPGARDHRCDQPGG